jgi:hypothetical protein
MIPVEEYTVRARATDLVWTGDPESLTMNVRELAVAVVVGVPDRTPVDVLNERPVGNVPVSVQE